MSDPLHDLSCAIHVHSTCSDGTATVPEIVEAARASGRDVVVLTDHDTMRARELGHEGWHGSVLLLVGEEVSPKGGHYLALGLERELDGGGLDEREIPGAVAAAGGFGFAAHPFSRGSRMARAIAPPHPWPHLDDPAIAGLELWSLETEVAEQWASPRAAWRSLADPERGLDAPPDANLRAWDEICARRRMVGIAGLDAHQVGGARAGRLPGRSGARARRRAAPLDRLQPDLPALMATPSRYPVPEPLRHTLLLGDWGRWVRDPIDLLRLTYLAGFIATVFYGDLGGAARLGVTAVFVYLARWIAPPRLFDLGFVLGMTLQGWGNVIGLFEAISWYDTLVHFVLSFWTAPLFYIGLARLGVVPDLGGEHEEHPLVGVLIVTLSLGLAFGALYEVYEYVVDQFGAHLYIGEADTVKDLATDAVGSGLGGVLLVAWAVRGWGTMHRVPAVQLQGLEDE